MKHASQIVLIDPDASADRIRLELISGESGYLQLKWTGKNDTGALHLGVIDGAAEDPTAAVVRLMDTVGEVAPYSCAGEAFWATVAAKVASVNWLLGALIAADRQCEPPELPPIEQGPWPPGPLGSEHVLLGVEWGYEVHEIELSFARWVRLVAGETWKTEQAYHNDGELFTATWTFTKDRILSVTYDASGVGWEGDLGDVDVITGPRAGKVDLARLVLCSWTRRIYR